MFGILSWNIRQGGGSRIANIIRTINTIQPYIIVLSEFKNNTSGFRIRSELLKSGFKHQLVTDAKADMNSILIASKIYGNTEIFPNSDPVYSHNIAAMHFESFSICGMYLPHKKKHVLFDQLLEMCLSDTPYILVGDFNTGINYIDQEGKSFWYQKEFEALLNANYYDAFRYVNGNVKDYSWYSHQGNGFRYDHTIVSRHLLPIVRDCTYLHNYREEGISDHSPMLLTLG